MMRFFVFTIVFSLLMPISWAEEDTFCGDQHDWCRYLFQGPRTDFSDQNPQEDRKTRHYLLAKTFSEYARHHRKVLDQAIWPPPDPKADLLSVFPQYQNVDDIFRDWVVITVILEETSHSDLTFELDDLSIQNSTVEIQARFYRSVRIKDPDQSRRVMKKSPDSIVRRYVFLGIEKPELETFTMNLRVMNLDDEVEQVVKAKTLDPN